MSYFFILFILLIDEKNIISYICKIYHITNKEKINNNIYIQSID